MDQAFRDTMTAGYTFKEPTLVIGSAMHEGELFNDTRVQIPLSMLNRHGLVAGATGTGKTKTLQLLAGQLSTAGVPVFVADIKGDLTGISLPGDADNAKIERAGGTIGLDFEPAGHPVEFFSLTGELGAQVRATVPSFGPLLLGKVLDLNETQTSRRSRWSSSTATTTAAAARPRGPRARRSSSCRRTRARPSSRTTAGCRRATVGVLLRERSSTSSSRARTSFFGEPEFDVEDLMRTTADGLGRHLAPRAADVMDQPAAVLDLHALDARPAVRRACPRSATCRSRSCASSSTRPTCCSTTRPRRSWTRSSGPPG